MTDAHAAAAIQDLDQEARYARTSLLIGVAGVSATAAAVAAIALIPALQEPIAAALEDLPRRTRRFAVFAPLGIAIFFGRFIKEGMALRRAVAEQRQARASAARPPMEPSGDETIVLSAGGAA